MKKHSEFCNTASRHNANMSGSSSSNYGSPMKKMKTEDKDEQFKKELDDSLDFLCKLTKGYVPDCAGMKNVSSKKSDDKNAKSA